jgi:hypothetical protein
MTAFTRWLGLPPVRKVRALGRWRAMQSTSTFCGCIRIVQPRSPPPHVHLQPGEFVRECAECIIATRRLMAQVPVITNARVPSRPAAEPKAAPLDTMADLGPDVADVEALENIS